MATSPERRAAWQELIDAADAPRWTTPQDLAHMSMNAAWQQDTQTRTAHSEGILHLGGSQTEDHTARIASLGSVLVALQNLVTAVGAALEGVRTKRGPLSADIITRTVLRQMQPIGMGSVTVTFAPEVTPTEELIGKEGVALVDQPVEQFVDRAVREALSLLQQAHDLGADADESEFLKSIVDRGPRVATAVRNFARVISQSDFETEATWRQPDRDVQFARFTPGDAKQVEQIIKARDLDEEPTVLVGRIFASSLQARWQLDLGEPGVVNLDMSKLQEPLDYVDFPLTQRVRVNARPRVRTFPDGTEVTAFVAQSIEAIPDDDGAEPDPDGTVGV